jgi:hypothetical protein
MKPVNFGRRDFSKKRGGKNHFTLCLHPDFAHSGLLPEIQPFAIMKPISSFKKEVLWHD